MEHLAPLDTWFLTVEDGVDHMHIASVATFEGPPPAYDAVVHAVDCRVGRVPRCRQRLQEVDLDLSRPVWVDDARFDAGYHVRRTALPAPGGDAELAALMGRVMSQELDRRRPLWEIWVVEGLADDRWALITKAHHCMVDGVGGIEVLSLTLDWSPDPQDGDGAGDGWTPCPEPSERSLVRDAVVHTALLPWQVARGATRTVRHPWRSARRGMALARGVLDLLPVVRPTPPTSLNGPIGPHRVWTMARTSLADAKAIGRAADATVNDVVLAAITRGFRDLLASRGEALPPDRVLRSMVPVSMRPDSVRGTGRLDNLVSTMFAELPVGERDPVRVLHRLHDEIAAHKAHHEAEGGQALLHLLEYAPPALVDLGIRTTVGVIQAFGQRMVNTVTTNVPGPQVPLYAFGRRLIEILPFVPVAEGITVGVAIFSYDGRLGFGVTGDRDASPDVDVLAAGIEAGIQDLYDRLVRASASSASPAASAR